MLRSLGRCLATHVTDGGMQLDHYSGALLPEDPSAIGRGQVSFATHRAKAQVLLIIDHGNVSLPVELSLERFDATPTTQAKRKSINVRHLYAAAIHPRQQAQRLE